MTLAAADPMVHLTSLGTLDLRIATLVLLLVLAAAIDLRSFRIPNWLTLTGAVIGLALSLVGEPQPLHAFLLAAGGMAAGLALMLPFWLLRVMGAGDVKLMAMAGAFVGLGQIVPVVLTVFIVGGVFALAWSVWRRVFRRMAANVGDIVQQVALAALSGGAFVPQSAGRVSAGKLPYGLSICAGTIAWVAARYLGYV